MEAQRTKNALLFVIALCLVLIVVRLYAFGDFVSTAQAAQGGSPTNLYGCAEVGKEPGTCTTWMPARMTIDGRLVVVVSSAKPTPPKQSQ